MNKTAVEIEIDLICSFLDVDSYSSFLQTNSKIRVLAKNSEEGKKRKLLLNLWRKIRPTAVFFQKTHREIRNLHLDFLSGNNVETQFNANFLIHIKKKTEKMEKALINFKSYRLAIGVLSKRYKKNSLFGKFTAWAQNWNVNEKLFI